MSICIVFVAIKAVAEVAGRTPVECLILLVYLFLLPSSLSCCTVVVVASITTEGTLISTSLEPDLSKGSLAEVVFVNNSPNLRIDMIHNHFQSLE